MKLHKTFLLINQLWVMLPDGETKAPPNIIFIYADDMGWNDVSFHGSPQFPTPNIDALAMSGIVLNNYYGQWLCTPSRGSLMSGQNAIRLGLQHYVIKPGEASGLPLDVVTLPQYLKRLGYSNHMIGKWHLGYMSKEYTPARRGFDSFFGYYNGFLDYYDYIMYDKTDLKDTPQFLGIDLQNETFESYNVVSDFRGPYATDTFTEKAEDIIKKHNTTKPLFLYFAHLATHSSLASQRYQAPPKYVKRVMHIKEVDRRVQGAATVALDDSVGRVFEDLREKGMLENTLFAFVVDNGGETIDGVGCSSNFPFRGKKQTLWEGGTHLSALLWSPLFKLKEPRISKQLMHVTDWLPTLYRAAGGNPKDIPNIDGIDMWDMIMHNKPSPRKEFLYNIDPILGISALRVGDMKVINGTSGYDSWYLPTKNCFTVNDNSSNCDFVKDGPIRRYLKQKQKWILKDENELKWRKNAAIVCSEPAPIENGGKCNPEKKPCLFDIAKDPCEYHNLANKYPKIVDDMMNKIQEYQKTAVKPQNKPSDPRANPQCHNFQFVRWLDLEHYNECTEYSSLAS